MRLAAAFGKFAAISTAILLIGEGLYFFWLAYIIGRLFSEAFGILAVPTGVWISSAKGVILFLLATYIINKGKIARWFIPLALILLVYGLWGAWTASTILRSPFGLLEGDVTALEFVSSIGFIGIGFLSLLEFRSEH